MQLFAVLGQGWIEDESENSMGCSFVSTDRERARARAKKDAEDIAEDYRKSDECLPQDERGDWQVHKTNGDEYNVYEENSQTWYSMHLVWEVSDCSDILG